MCKDPTIHTIKKDKKSYTSSQEFNDIFLLPQLLYEAANKGLDLNIRKISRDIFDRALEEHHYLIWLVDQICTLKAIFPSSKDGKYQKLSKNDSYHSDSECSYLCLDKLLLNYTGQLKDW